MLHCMDARGSLKGDCAGCHRLGARNLRGLTNKKSGPFFGNRAMLLTDNHQAWRLSERLTTHGT